MTGRISRHQMFLDIARIASKRSTCFRLNVGAVITQHNRPVSIGYNGVAPGKDHCPGETCPGADACKETIHAEENALTYIPNCLSGDFEIYTTHSPCYHCSCLLIEFNRKNKDKKKITACFYETEYRDTTNLISLVSSGIKVLKITPAGYLINPINGKAISLP